MNEEQKGIMGLLCSKEDTSGDEYAPALPTVEKRQKVPKEELNIDDFIIENRENEVIVRAPGTLNQQFCIENCRGCTFYLLDITDCISIDDCDDCTFVIGPCESAVRIGTTTNSRFIVSCQQFRTRDCKDLDVMIHIHAGQPIIESSTKIRFGAFDYNYFGLEGHFGEAGMEPWNSEWSNIHDFNDTKGLLKRVNACMHK